MSTIGPSGQRKHHLLEGFAAPFRQSRAFPYLWLGHLVSFLGSSVTMVILPVLVYSLTGSTTIMGMVMAAYMLPNVIMLPVSGHIVDRYDRVRIMMLADIARFIVMITTAALSLTGVLSIPFLYGLVACYGLLDGLFQPAYAAVRATVFTPDIRVAANSLTQITTQSVRLIGPALGGLLITHLSAGFGFGIDAFTYLISLICLVYLRRVMMTRLQSAAAETELPAKPAARTSPAPHWREDFAEGIHVLRSQPWLWITILAFCFVNICYTGVISVLLPWLFKVHHGWPPYLYGLAVTFSGVGAIAAGLLYGLRPIWNHRGILAYGGAMISGTALLLLPFAGTPAAAVTLFAVEGFGLMIFGLIWEISLQELVPEGSLRTGSQSGYVRVLRPAAGRIYLSRLAGRPDRRSTDHYYFSGLGLSCVALVLCVPAIRKFQ